MQESLWGLNTPQSFWQCRPNPPDAAWQEAVRRALPVLRLPESVQDMQSVLVQVLGEGQFGPEHWRLTPTRRLYYRLKPLMPLKVIRFVKCASARVSKRELSLGWPIEDRYARFLWEVMRQLLMILRSSQIEFRPFWPEGRRLALVLTHDIETSEGQKHIGNVADLEERLGFRSSINFVPERYPVDHGLVNDLRRRGFEIGIHGLKHDGKLFSSLENFKTRVESINRYLQAFDAEGFRSPLTHRNPYWMQALDIAYDLSFFDTDPYEAMPGGCMSIWPYFIGHFIELPYTLAQDCTVGLVLGEKTPRLWLEKMVFIESYSGLALLNSHPDYLKEQRIQDLYTGFLKAMQEKDSYWRALPGEVARWWRFRAQPQFEGEDEQMRSAIRLEGRQLSLVPQSLSARQEAFA